MKAIKISILILFSATLSFLTCACSDNTLTVATSTEVPPYCYYEDGKIVGIDAEIAAAIADKLGMTLVIRDMGFDSVVSSVSSGKCDIGMAGLSISEDWRPFVEDWKKQADFSISYDFRGEVIIVRDDSDINGPHDLKGKKIGIQLSVIGCKCVVDDYGKENVVCYTKGSDAVLDLVQRKIDCVIINSRSGRKLAVENKGIKVLDYGYIEEKYAVAVAKNNTKLLNKVNQAILDLSRDGTVKDIVNKYIY